MRTVGHKVVLESQQELDDYKAKEDARRVAMLEYLARQGIEAEKAEEMWRISCPEAVYQPIADEDTICVKEDTSKDGWHIRQDVDPNRIPDSDCVAAFVQDAINAAMEAKLSIPKATEAGCEVYNKEETNEDNTNEVPEVTEKVAKELEAIRARRESYRKKRQKEGTAYGKDDKQNRSVQD